MQEKSAQDGSLAVVGAAGTYVGRFAPSPTGLLHAGSLVAALASWLDARAHGGRWLVRIEDVDTTRNVTGAGEAILAQLAACGLLSDAPVLWQTQREAAYAQALQRLAERGLAYACACSRSDIQAAPVQPGRLPGVYPGTCRAGLNGRPGRAWRVRCGEGPNEPALRWHDRWLGAQQQSLWAEVGDCVVHRADGCWAYQLAMVVDDAHQSITDVVRGADLADNTPRQIHLQRLLGLPTPRYLHTPLVLAPDGQKLSKQTGAQALHLETPQQAIAALAQAVRTLGLSPGLDQDLARSASVPELLARAVAAWRQHAV
ncbi:tRNA glutamyl-Q(34) synthetase GluQRS [Amphibiibacter pelophylacis]|uniref:tRNA glutamyl-Q(34) synthetase GluQRS n=1 Tax=Amphibiibacter pelophylacis TaxID=1799477 RepID=A0ACC6P4S1_9BURK